MREPCEKLIDVFTDYVKNKQASFSFGGAE